MFHIFVEASERDACVPLFFVRGAHKNIPLSGGQRTVYEHSVLCFVLFYLTRLRSSSGYDGIAPFCVQTKLLTATAS